MNEEESIRSLFEDLVIQLAGAFDFPFPGPIIDHVVGDAVKPGGEARLRLEAGQRVPCLDEDLLGEVPRVGFLVDHVADHGENSSPVTGYQRVIGTEVPTAARGPPTGNPRPRHSLMNHPDRRNRQVPARCSTAFRWEYSSDLKAGPGAGGDFRQHRQIERGHRPAQWERWIGMWECRPSGLQSGGVRA